MKTCMVRLNIKAIPYHIITIKAKDGSLYEMPSDCYTAPLKALSNGKIIGYCDNKDSIPNYNDELIGIRDSLENGEISNKEALMQYSIMKDWFNLTDSHIV